MDTVSQKSKVKVINLNNKDHDDFLDGGFEEGAAPEIESGGSSSKASSASSSAPSSASSSAPSSAPSSASSTSTMDMLSEDPLFLVLCQFLLNNKEENIVTVLDKINTSIQDLTAAIKATSSHKAVKKSG